MATVIKMPPIRRISMRPIKLLRIIGYPPLGMQMARFHHVRRSLLLLLRMLQFGLLIPFEKARPFLIGRKFLIGRQHGL